MADSGNYRIQKFDSNGRFLASWSYFDDLDLPGHIGFIEMDQDDNIYASDWANSVIYKLDADGQLIAVKLYRPTTR